MKVYLTTGLFIIVSWISFIVPPEVVPGNTNNFHSCSRITILSGCCVQIALLMIIFNVLFHYLNLNFKLAGRMALLVTLFLVLVNIFNSVTGNAPKAEGLTAVETWVILLSFSSALPYSVSK